MSAKWVRNKAWEDQHLTGALRPVKWVMRALSSITLAVTLLVLVTIYGILASIPIGLLALAPTFLVYGLTLVVVVAVVAGAPSVLVAKLVGKRSRAWGFAAGVLAFIALGLIGTWGWVQWVWPSLQYNSITGEGLRFFAGFVEQYKSVPMRRLPGMEMSELEFYAWWPLTLVLLVFVLNMVVTTIRRIEFRFENIGVLSVHSGIVIIALGSAFYAAGKREGDMLLQSGKVDEATGRITPGIPETTFFDNTRVVLKVDQGRGPEQWEIDGLPRYNDYNLSVAGVGAPMPEGTPGDGGRTLEIPLVPPPVNERMPARVDRDIRIDIVGYAAYAEVIGRWLKTTPDLGEPLTPMRTVTLMRSTGESTVSGEPIEFIPSVPSERVRRPGQGSVMMQYTIGLPDSRWEELGAPLPDGARWGLIVEVPALNIARVYSVQRGQRIVLGATPEQPAFTLTVQDLLNEPAMPIITKGFEGATTSQAIIRVEPGVFAPAMPGTPIGSSGLTPPFTRYAHTLLPEIDQDLSDEKNDRGMPKRGAPDPRIRLRVIDANTTSVFFDERAPAAASAPGTPGSLRAIVRLAGSQPVRTDAMVFGQSISLVRDLAMRVGEGVPHVRRQLAPAPVPLLERDTQNVGNHKRAAMAVRVSLQNTPGWSMVAWLPFVEYYGTGPGEQTIPLPDGRSVRLAFSRHEHPLPGMFVRLIDFEMFPYPHSTQPRDFRSMLEVVRGPGIREVFNDSQFRGVDRAIEEGVRRGVVTSTIAGTSLNEPLLIGPYLWDENSNVLVNSFGWVFDRLGPFRYKFAQAGWDNSNWMQTLEASKRGEVKEPFARFTILGVGNNPGIVIIAAGSILMALGIPWAFYLKPWLLRRKKRLIQEALARGDWKPPARAGRAKAGQSAGVQS